MFQFPLACHYCLSRELPIVGQSGGFPEVTCFFFFAETFITFVVD